MTCALLHSVPRCFRAQDNMTIVHHTPKARFRDYVISGTQDFMLTNSHEDSS